MAWLSARSSCASARASAEVIHCDVPSAAAILPSRLVPSLATTYGRPVRRWNRYGVRTRVAAAAPGTDFDVDTGGAQPANAGARDAHVGILDRDDDPAHAGVDERIGTRAGTAHVRARFEGHDRGRAGGGRSRGAQCLDLGVRATRRLRRALADHDAVDDAGRSRPTGSARRGDERPMRAAGLDPSLRRRAPGPRLRRPRERGRRRPTPTRRVARRRWCSRPSPIRTLTVGPGLAPGRRTTGGRAFAGFPGSEPSDGSLLVVTAGRDFHPTPRAVFVCSRL